MKLYGRENCLMKGCGTKSKVEGILRSLSADRRRVQLSQPDGRGNLL